ncbi:putative glycosyl hydrolase family 61 protein 3 [Elsinoe fawcettii]|nr:putative glycosyl hydrolase family 61 protein 3 [Elsinoe fawcettii]
MKSFFALSCLAAGTAAHTIFTEFWVNGVSQGFMQGVRTVEYDGPIMDVTSPDIVCNGAVNTFSKPFPPTKIISVPAGASATAEWHHTLKGRDASDKSDPIDISHLGPTIIYLAKVDSALNTNVQGLKWFKIFEDGLDAQGQWGVNRLYNNAGKVSFTIPKCIPSGQYLLRAEIIALHAAQSYPGAQFYMECAQLSITGGGSANPATVSFPGAYKGTDPGISFNLYYPKPTSYTVPGPAVFKC